MWKSIEHGIPTDRDFLAGWADPDGCIEAIEWYITMDASHRVFMNQNSCNQNEFTEKEMFTHWTDVDQVVEGSVA